MIRKKAYNYFWKVHSLYIVLYILCIIHGLARLTATPAFWLFFIGPAIIYTLDKVISLRTKFMGLDIIETELLPSDVLKVKFYRPPNFKYLSGQWIRLSCTEIKPKEFHSFTLTSAPHENFLSCHIKAQGPWTWKLRNYFDPSNFNAKEMDPKIQLDGPFGGGNQDWYKFEVAVMVGGGIGVTPYASILNDLVFGTSTNRYSGVACKKVYFLWTCPSHRHFEWFIDVLRDVERKDVTNVLEMHIFITQFFHKFDLRTTMLYICENHFQRISKRSMFTGLKAVNHFGRPDMTSFLKFVQKKHSYVSKIGVFSCGPRPLTKSIMSACEEVNQGRKLPYFIHHFENFGWSNDSSRYFVYPDDAIFFFFHAIFVFYLLQYDDEIGSNCILSLSFLFFAHREMISFCIGSRAGKFFFIKSCFQLGWLFAIAIKHNTGTGWKDFFFCGATHLERARFRFCDRRCLSVDYNCGIWIRSNLNIPNLLVTIRILGIKCKKKT